MNASAMEALEASRAELTAERSRAEALQRSLAESMQEQRDMLMSLQLEIRTGWAIGGAPGSQQTPPAAAGEEGGGVNGAAPGEGGAAAGHEALAAMQLELQKERAKCQELTRRLRQSTAAAAGATQSATALGGRRRTAGGRGRGAGAGAAAEGSLAPAAAGGDAVIAPNGTNLPPSVVAAVTAPQPPPSPNAAAAAAAAARLAAGGMAVDHVAQSPLSIASEVPLSGMPPPLRLPLAGNSAALDRAALSARLLEAQARATLKHTGSSTERRAR